MKRCVSFLAAFLLTVSMTALASAAEPRWSELDRIDAGLDISASGPSSDPVAGKGFVYLGSHLKSFLKCYLPLYFGTYLVLILSDWFLLFIDIDNHSTPLYMMSLPLGVLTAFLFRKK